LKIPLVLFWLLDLTALFSQPEAPDSGLGGSSKRKKKEKVKKAKSTDPLKDADGNSLISAAGAQQIQLMQIVKQLQMKRDSASKAKDAMRNKKEVENHTSVS
jgi:hypothetical protein